MKKIGFFIFMALVMTSCVSQIPQRSILIYDEKAYVVAKPLLRHDFYKQKIDTEILPSLSPANPLDGLIGHKMAKNLYKKLSLSFRFQDKDFNANPIFLEDYVSNDAEIIMHSYGFTIDQGQELITVTILGEADWNSDNVNDYLISFRINQKELNYNVKNYQAHVALPSRNYILLIKNINASIYNAHILYIHDYIKEGNGIRSEVYKNHEGAQNSLFQDHSAISFEQGQEQIVFAPDAKENNAKRKDKKNRKNRKNEDEQSKENNEKVKQRKLAGYLKFPYQKFPSRNFKDTILFVCSLKLLLFQLSLNFLKSLNHLLPIKCFQYILSTYYFLIFDL